LTIQVTELRAVAELRLLFSPLFISFLGSFTFLLRRRSVCEEALASIKI
jgi:hypothetical protein